MINTIEREMETIQMQIKCKHNEIELLRIRLNFLKKNYDNIKKEKS